MGSLCAARKDACERLRALREMSDVCEYVLMSTLSYTRTGIYSIVERMRTVDAQVPYSSSSFEFNRLAHSTNGNVNGAGWRLLHSEQWYIFFVCVVCVLQHRR